MNIQLTPKEEKYLKKLQILMENLTNPSTFTSIGMRIEYWAKKTPNKIGLLFEDKSWPWKSINEEANKIANYFFSLGLKPGETVGIMIENSPEFLFTTGGISKLKGISSLVNVNLRKLPLIHIMTISEPKFIVVDGDCLPAIQEIISEIKLKNNEIFVVNNPEHKNHDFIDLPNELNSISTKNPNTINDFEYGDEK